MTAISTRQPAVEIEYTGKGGKRVTKKYADANKAKAAYLAFDRDGKEPKVVGERQLDLEEPAAPEATEQPAAEQPKKERKPRFGVAATAKTRAYYAGIVIGRVGRDAGVTPAMVAEVDQAFGKPNPVESEICLRNAWHALRGFAEATA